MRFDELLQDVGEFGPYQKHVFALICLPNVLVGFVLLNPVMLLATPLHRCALPGYDNDTYAIQSGYHASLVNVTIPPSDLDTETYDRCHVYITHDNLPNIEDGITQFKCKKWVYDTTIYENTYVSELDLVCDREILGANAAMVLYGGMLCGSLASGVLSDRFGRKIVLIVSVLLMSASGAALAWPYSYTVFVVLEFVLGGASSSSYLTGFVLAIEITGTSKRMWPGVCVSLPYTSGILLYTAIAYGFRSVTAIQLVTSLPGLLCISFWWLLPQSPRWLLSKGRIKEAEYIVRKAARWNGTTYKEGTLDSRMFDAPRDEKTDTRCSDLVSSKAMCFKTIIICFNWAATNFAYFGLALNTENLAGDFYLNFFLTSLMEIPSYLFVLATIDRLGRRLIYIIVMVVGGVSCLSTLFAAEYAKDMGIVTVALSMVGRLGVNAGFSVMYVHSAEIFPTVSRHVGMGVASLCGRVGSMVAPYLVTLGKYVGGSFGRSLPLIVIGVLAVTSSVAAAFLPETLNKHMPDTIRDAEKLGEMDKDVSETTKLLKKETLVESEYEDYETIQSY